MKKILIPIIIAAFGLCSCEEYFELKGSEGAPRMFVECYAGLTDTTFFSVYKAVSVNSRASEGTAFNVEKFDFTINGSKANITKVENSFYWTTDPIPAGSRLTLDLDTRETEPIHATTTVPVVQSFTTTADFIDNGTMPMIKFHLKLDGKIEPTDRFGISIREHVVIRRDNGDQPQEYYNDMTPMALNSSEMSLSDLLMASLMPMPNFYVTGYPDLIECLFYSGEDFTDGELDVAASVTGFEPAWEEYANFDEETWEPRDTIHVTRADSLSVRIIRFSEETFGYINALYNQETDYLAMIGLSPAHFAYTNISGGYGVLGGLTISDGLWYDMLEVISR